MNRTRVARLLVATLLWLAGSLIVGAGCFFAVLLLAGPHSTAGSLPRGRIFLAAAWLLWLGASAVLGKLLWKRWL